MDLKTPKTPEVQSSPESTKSSLDTLMETLNRGMEAMGNGKTLESLKQFFESLKDSAPLLSSILQAFLGKAGEEKSKTDSSQGSAQKMPEQSHLPTPEPTPTPSPQTPNNPPKSKEVSVDHFANVEIFGSSTAKLMAGLAGKNDEPTEGKLTKAENARRTGKILESMTDHADSLKGKAVCFQPGLNHLRLQKGTKTLEKDKIKYSGFHPEEILNSVESAAKICKENGARELVVFSGFPFDQKFRRDGNETDVRHWAQGLELVEALSTYDWKALSQRIGIPVRFINFYEHYAYQAGDSIPEGYKIGDLKQEYEKDKVIGYENEIPIAGKKRQNILPDQKRKWVDEMIHPRFDLARKGLELIV